MPFLSPKKPDIPPPPPEPEPKSLTSEEEEAKLARQRKDLEAKRSGRKSLVIPKDRGMATTATKSAGLKIPGN